MELSKLLLIILINITVLLLMQRFHYRSMENRLKQLKQELSEMEDMVAAIIEEFESVAKKTKGNNETATGEVSLEFSEIAKKQSAVTEAVQSEPVDQVEPIDSKTEFSGRKQILELSSQGMTADEIARTMGVGRGEVNLVLGMHQRS